MSNSAHDALQDLGALAQIHYLTPDEVSFIQNDGGFVGMKKGEKWHPRVLFYRAYPFTYPEEYISVRDIDANELGMLRRLADFPEDVQDMLRQQMQLRYFSPQITAIHRAKEEFGYVYWEVDTTAGPSRFTSRNSGGAIVPVSSSRIIIVDIDGNRFEIPDTAKLDPKDLKKIELYL